MLKSFYEGKTILLTGSTGFLGKVVLEKIMRSLPGVKTIYLAISPKVSINSSLSEQMFKSFNRVLRRTQNTSDCNKRS
jgi:fatty acyl-CoA reductase